MIKNKKSLYTLVQLIITAAALLLATASYSWLTIGDGIHGMTYTIAKIDSSVMVYRANDDNLNGVPNLLSAPEDAVYYTERFSFTPINGEVYALAEDSELNMLTEIELDNILPTAVYTLKYSMINRSTIENRIKFSFSSATLDADTAKLLSAISVRIGEVSSESVDSYGELSFGEKIFLCDAIDGTSFEEIALKFSDEDSFIPGFSGIDSIDNRKDLWLQFEMESYEALIAHNTDFGLTEAEYEALQGKSATIPNLYIFFEIIYDSKT